MTSKKDMKDLLGIGAGLTEGQRLKIVYVRFDEKAEGESGYPLVVIKDSDGRKFHSFSSKIIKQLKDISEEVGGNRFDPALECEVVGSDTRGGFRVLSLESIE